jgi:hypothetical protein
MAGQQAGPAGFLESPGHLGEVLEDLVAGRSLVVAGVLAGLVDAVLAQRQRVHAVVGGGGVQANERIRVPPMTPRGLSAVDQRDLHVGLGQQRVGEGEAGCARPYDQVVRAVDRLPDGTTLFEVGEDLRGRSFARLDGAVEVALEVDRGVLAGEVAGALLLTLGAGELRVLADLPV